MEQDKAGKPQFGIVNFERRRFVRFSVNLPVEYSQVDSTSKSSSGHAGNASEGGLMLYLPEKLGVGQHLRVKIYFTSEPGLNFIEALGQVAWVEISFAKEGDHRYGLKFLNISPEDLSRLKDYLDNLAQIKAPLRITP
jgi:c-di-GMP-binding flagellar brake protein YcgR